MAYDPLKFTKLARELFRDFGANTLYTNKYDECRTVKSYLELTKKERDYIKNELNEAGCEGVTIKLRPSTHMRLGRRGYVTIIRIPNEVPGTSPYYYEIRQNEEGEYLAIILERKEYLPKLIDVLSEGSKKEAERQAKKYIKLLK